MANPDVLVVNSQETLNELVERVVSSQKEFEKLNQEQVDEIFSAAAIAANQARVVLAEMAVNEAGMGVLEDKAVKNHIASEFVHDRYRNMKTCGVVEKDEAGGFSIYAEPVGVLAGIVPCTNPTATTIFKSLIALKTRNCIVFSPHPRTAKCTIEAARIIRDAAIANGAPRYCISWIDHPTVDLCNALMKHPKIVMIVATGATGLVRAAYSSGKPAFGGGAGNTPVIIDETADIQMAVNSVLISKTFDNGMICASEQSVIAVSSVAEKVKQEFRDRGAHFISKNEKDQLASCLFTDNMGTLNPKAVGQSAEKLAELAKLVDVPSNCRLLLIDLESVGEAERLSHEKLCPCLGFYEAPDFDAALQRGLQLVQYGGMGHTSVLYTDTNAPTREERVKKFQAIMPTGRTLICMPTSQGAIGNVYNFRQTTSLSLGCGSWGNTSSAEALQAKHLLNFKQVCERREHVLWLKIPSFVFFNRGTVREVFRELHQMKRAFVVSSAEAAGHRARVVDELLASGLSSDEFTLIEPAVTTKSLQVAVEQMNRCAPECVVGVGGSAVMSMAKLLRLVYENPDVSLKALGTRFMDMQRRIVEFPHPGKKIKKVVCISTTCCLGGEVTPFASIKDSESNSVYSLADYSLTPDVAIIDSDFVMSLPAGVLAEGGMCILANALESYVSMYASDYTRSYSHRGLMLVFDNLEKAVGGDAKAREACHNAAAISGMAFGNAFVGVCNSLAHQLTAYFRIGHGVACALLICPTMKFNAEISCSRQGTFPQYTHPMAAEQYAELADSIPCLATPVNVSAEKKVDCLIKKIDDLIVRLKLPRRLKDLGITEEVFQSKLDSMALAAFDDQCTNANPRYPLIRELREILESIY